MPDNRDFFTALAIVVVVAILPWFATLWPSGSLFGFPWSGFLPLLAVPVLLIALVRPAPHPEQDEDDV